MSKTRTTKTQMNQTAVSRIYSSTAQTGNGTIPAGTFAARAASAAAKNSTKNSK